MWQHHHLAAKKNIFPLENGYVCEMHYFATFYLSALVYYLCIFAVSVYPILFGHLKVCRTPMQLAERALHWWSIQCMIRNHTKLLYNVCCGICCDHHCPKARYAKEDFSCLHTSLAYC